MAIWLNFFNAFLDGGQKKSSPKPNFSKYRTWYMQLNANEDIKDLCLIILFLANLIILHNYNQDWSLQDGVNFCVKIPQAVSGIFST